MPVKTVPGRLNVLSRSRNNLNGKSYGEIFNSKIFSFIFFLRNIVTISFYMLRSLLTGLKPSYCKRETCTYTRSRSIKHTKRIQPSKWKKIENSIHFISSTRRSVKERSTKPSPSEILGKTSVLENWKTLRQLLSKKDRIL